MKNNVVALKAETQKSELLPAEPLTQDKLRNSFSGQIASPLQHNLLEFWKIGKADIKTFVTTTFLKKKAT